MGTKKKTTKRTSGADIWTRIQQTSRLVAFQAEAMDVARYLDAGGEATVKPMPSSPHSPEACWLSYHYTPLHGVQFELLGLVTGDDGSSPLHPGERAERIAEWMAWLTPRAAAIAAQRKAVTAAANKAIAEAAAEGIDIELLSVDLAPVHTTLSPDRKGGWQTVFYVRMVMDHDDRGVLTRDAYTVDADDADEFADYMRNRVIADIRKARARYQQLVIA